MRKLSFVIGIVFFLLFLLGGMLVGTLHSEWGQKKIFDSLTSAMRESGWTAEIERIRGSPFETIEITGLELKSPQGDELRIGSLKTQISLLRLLRREIALQQLHADKISWTRTEKDAKELGSDGDGIPFSLSLPNFQLTDISLPNSGSQATVRGSLRIARYNKRARIQIEALRKDVPGARLKVLFSVSRNRETILEADLSTASFLAALSPWIYLPADGSADLHLFAKGRFSDFWAAASGTSGSGSIQGSVRGTIAVVEAGSLEHLLHRRWSLFSALHWKNQELELSRISLKGEGAIQLKGSLLTAPRTQQLKSSNLQLTFESLKQTGAAPVYGPLFAHLQSDDKQAKLSVSSPKLTWEDLSLESIAARATAQNENGVWKGSFDAQAKLLDNALEAHANLTLGPDVVQIDAIDVRSPFVQAQGALRYQSNLIGEIKAHVGNLHEFNAFNPTWSLYGKADVALRWKEGPFFEIDAKGSDIFYKGWQIENTYLYFDSTGDMGTLYAELERATYQSLLIESLSLDADSLDGKTWLARVLADGDWRGPLSIGALGHVVFEKSRISVDLQDLAGNLFFKELALSSPVQMKFGPNLLQIHGFELSIGGATILAELDHEADATNASLLFDRLPLDFLSLNPLEISVEGLINLDAHFAQEKAKTSGTLHAQIVDIEIGTLSEQNSIEGKTDIDLKLANDQLAAVVKMDVRGEQILNFTANLPWELSLSPFVSRPFENKSAKASLVFQGNVEEVLDFFNIGPHRLEGSCSCDLKMHGTIDRPLLQGSCRLDNGFYENYYSGLELKDLQAEIFADGRQLHLRSLTAKDIREKGVLSMTGEANLSYRERFPFHFDGQFTRLAAADLAWMQMEAGGSVQISGNLDSARISGQAIVLKGDFSIPERIPPSLPNLQVKYIHAPKPVAVEEANLEKKSRYPIFFDYRVMAPEGISISGRGLVSKWTGDFAVGGTYTHLEAKGELNMIRGDFTFSGRTFELTEGSLTFTGRPQEMPILNIAAKMQLQNLLIIARLKGYLNAPLLSFHSIPPLPMGSILSHLLFGRDLSEINAIQAAQLVQSISTFSGVGPNVFDNTRRSLGVDRLRIIAKPVGDEGAETYSLQVGKYVTRGVLVSVSQGFEKGSTNLEVELDLTNGFVFEAAAEQIPQQQGKFSLKWSHNY